MDKNLENKNKGNFGETEITLWLEKGGLCVNDSKRNDINGWDLIAEIPNEYSNNIPLDSRYPKKTIFIQAKATHNKKNAISIKLSNAQKMASDHNPHFIVLVQYNKRNEVIGIFVKHIWEEDIYNILKTIRKFESEGDVSLHKKYIKIKLNQVVNENELISYINRELGLFCDNYHNKKTEIFKKVGYENSCGLMNVTLSYKNNEEFEDFILGMRELEIPVGSFAPSRFEIIINKHIENFSNGKLSAQPEFKEVKYRVTFDKDKKITISGKLFGVENINNDKMIYRVDIYDFVFKVGSEEGEKTVNIKLNKTRTIEELYFIVLWTVSNCMQLEIYSNGQWLRLGELNNVGTDNQKNWLGIYNIIDLLYNFSKMYDYEDLKLSFDDIFNELDGLIKFHNYVFRDKILVTLKSSFPEDINIKEINYFVTPIIFEISDYYISGIMRYPIKSIEENKITLKKGEIIETFIINGNKREEIFTSWYKKRIDELRQTFQTGTIFSEPN